MRARTLIAALAIGIAATLAVTGALADGSAVGKWLTLKEVVSRSVLVLEARVREVDHVWATREAYGEERRYITEYRLLVDVVSVIRGKASDHEKKAYWLVGPGRTVPGRWVVIEEDYASAYNLGVAAKGDVFLAFFEDGETHARDDKEDPGLHIWFPEARSFLKKVRTLVARTPPPRK